MNTSPSSASWLAASVARGLALGVLLAGQVPAAEPSFVAGLARQANVDLNQHVLDRRKAHDYAEVVYDARKQYLNTLRNELDALRTMAANVRSQT